jgi:cytidyltransferase-like protein
MNARKPVAITGAFDDLNSRSVRLLQEAARLGDLTVLLWPDSVVQEATGKPPRFPQAERSYFLSAIRYVTRVVPLTGPGDPGVLPEVAGFKPAIWVVEEPSDDPRKKSFCAQHGLQYHVLPESQLRGFPAILAPPPQRASLRKKVIVTGSFDWFHSGHIRFFEEVSAHGDLYVIVGHDANIRLLKGEGHPLFPQEERRYLVQSIRFVTEALVSTGHGWLDAEPEIQRLKPDIYAVNEDGDKGGKREYCEKHGIQYLVLKRIPPPGLPRRSSTDLRGF